MRAIPGIRRRHGRTMVETVAAVLFMLVALFPPFYRWLTGKSGPVGLTAPLLPSRIGASMLDQIRSEFARPPVPDFPVEVVHTVRTESAEPLGLLLPHGQGAATGLIEGEGAPPLARYLHLDELAGRTPKEDKGDWRNLLANWKYTVEFRQVGLDTDLDGKDENDASEIQLNIAPAKELGVSPLARVTTITDSRSKVLEVGK